MNILKKYVLNSPLEKRMQFTHEKGGGQTDGHWFRPDRGVKEVRACFTDDRTWIFEVDFWGGSFRYGMDICAIRDFVPDVDAALRALKFRMAAENAKHDCNSCKFGGDIMCGKNIVVFPLNFTCADFTARDGDK